MLSLHDVDVFYGAAQVLRKVSLEVREGEIVALLGSNGAGKSTTLRTISGLLRPERGEIVFNGHQIHNLSPFRILTLGIAHCPEGRRIWPQMTVREHLLMGAYIRKDQNNVPSDMEMIFHHFSILKEKINELAANLSGGQQQMLAMGRALLSKPKLFLLDEPSLGLGPMLVREVLDIIRELNESGTTVLVVEQNARAALRIAHRSYVMETGRIVVEDTAKNMLENPMVRKVYLGVT